MLDIDDQIRRIANYFNYSIHIHSLSLILLCLFNLIKLWNNHKQKKIKIMILELLYVIKVFYISLFWSFPLCKIHNHLKV